MDIIATRAYWIALAIECGKLAAIWIVAITVLMLAEYRWPAGPQPTWRERAHNFALGLILIVSGAVFGALLHSVPETMSSLGLTSLVIGSWRPQSTLDIVAATILYALVWDLLQYGYHRLLHAVPRLWFVHSLHHADDHLSAASALRNTIWHPITGYLLISLPLLVLLSPDILVWQAQVFCFAVFGFFNHANIDLDMGRLGMVLSGPKWHRLHHSKATEHFGCNYAAFFPFIDIAFGTYQAPDRRPVETGLADQPMRTPGGRNLIKDSIGL